MATHRIRFENGRGIQLAAHLDLPADGRPYAYALFAHCFTCSKNLKAVGHLTRAMTRAGYGVLRFDFTGLGQSKGDFADTDFSSNIGDLESAAAWLTSEYEAPRLLVGHSLGGAAVLHAAGKLPSVRAVATVGAPYDPAHVRHLFAESEEEILKSGHAKVSIGGRPFTIRKEFLDDLEAQDPATVIGNLDTAILVMHSPVDTIVGIDNAALIYKAAKHPKSFVSLDSADHLLSSEEDALYAGGVLSAWSRRYIEVPSEQKSDRHGHHHVTVTLDASRYRTEIVAGGHALVADEPESAGGTNRGPSPYDLLVSGLGACTAITLRMYADRKKWPMDEVHVHLTHEKTHAEDCDCDSGDRMGKIDLVEREIELVGELTDEQRSRLLEIADKCPVHRSLAESQVVVKTTLKQVHAEA
ncbi:MAG: osmotically inducible protein C [Bacteroidetes bacterium CG12_big_fil_rev_8_21_14_0_65_60_17]|nr:MAG: osmotically inducible protein C [Bacteroidetes bacterium CG12_big_fil_rev_8_21_14_0_65_60_17]